MATPFLVDITIASNFFLAAFRNNNMKVLQPWRIQSKTIWIVATSFCSTCMVITNKVILTRAHFPLSLTLCQLFTAFALTGPKLLYSGFTNRRARQTRGAWIGNGTQHNSLSLYTEFLSDNRASTTPRRAETRAPSPRKQACRGRSRPRVRLLEVSSPPPHRVWLAKATPTW